MTMTLAITFEPDPPPGDVAAVRAGLSAYNRERAPDDTYHPFALFVRDAQGAAAGGLLGGFIWEWLYVEILWLRPDLRAQGYGSRLLAEAERLAGERGCFGIQLDTMSFQSLAFYERRGYTVFGVLENFPPGQRKYYLQKLLAPPPGR